jgi:apolipoprotein N-acyltransferase
MIMKTFKLSKNSWHYWLASFGDDLRMYSVHDICSYVRAMLVGSFQLLFVTAVISAIAGIALFSIGNLFSWLFLGYQLSQLTLMFFALIAGLIGAGLIIAFIEASKNRVETTEPGFVRLAYRRVKEKTCSLVEFE